MFSDDDIRNILSQYNPKVLFFHDSNYYSFSIDDLKAFAAVDQTNKFDYKDESADCDDFAYVFLGEVKKWCWSNNVKAGTCFGIISGDLRTAEAPNTPRYHAANIYITPDKQVFVFEPMSDTFQSIHTNSIIELITI